MDCNQIETMLADYLGNELDEQSRSTVDEHLRTCATCHREVEELQSTVATLSQLDTVSHGDARNRTRHLHIARRTSLPQRIILTSLRTAAVLLVGVFLGRMSQTPQQDTTTVSTGGPQIVAHANAASIHPQWIEFAKKLNQNSSGMAGSLRYLAKGLNR